MANTLNTTELDFDQIKSNIVDYFQQLTDSNGQLIYKDYNFQGSALSTIIDILAYNTHYNAMTAHMAINESFIDSAQLRSSVVSAAKLLGYVPRSATSSKVDAYLRIGVSGANPPTTLFIDKNTLFSTSYKNKTYYYVLKDGVTLTREGSTYKYLIGGVENKVTLQEGRRVVKRLLANASNEYERYIIDDDTIDINTLIVRVYANQNNNAESVEFVKYDNVSIPNGDTNVYYIGENTLGSYEITFGNNIIGKKLSPLNVIEIEYISCNGVDANGAPGPFIHLNPTELNTNTNTFSVTLTVSSPSGGGSNREAIDSIRANSTSSFVTQNRAVTADDYQAIIKQGFDSDASVSVWGGEDAIPPQYGKVLIAIKKKNTAAQLSEVEKQIVRNLLSSKKVLGIIPEVVDTEVINIMLDVLFKYNSNITSLSKAQLENAVRNDVVKKYNDTMLSSFGSVFRYSEFTRSIDTYNSAIINSHVRVFVSKNFEIDPLSYGEFTIKYGTPLTIDDGYAIASYSISAPWLLDGENVFLGEKENPNNSTARTLYIYTKSNGVENPIQDIGSIYLNDGTVKINPFGISDDAFDITLDLIPISNDIVSRRNQIISIDYNRCNVVGAADEIVVGGLSKATAYQTFTRDR